jgi:very-short-patch-repair endonuclease
MDREDARALALLVARAPSHAAGLLLVALHALERRPKLRSNVEVGAHRIDVLVELDGRRLAILLGRTGEHRTAADQGQDAALERAGWAVYRLPPDRVLARPLRAVGDVLAALQAHGAPVAARVSDQPARAPWWKDRDACEEGPPVELGVVGLPGTPANGAEEAVLP